MEKGGGGEAPLRRKQLVSASAQLHPSAAAAAGAFLVFFNCTQGHSCYTCDRKYHKQKTLCVTELQATASHSLEKH